MPSILQELFLVIRIISRKISQIFHSVSLLVRPFFPSGKGSCGVTEEANSTVLLQSPLEYSNRTIFDGSEPAAAVSDEVPTLAWPFIICSGIHLLPALGFLLMGNTLLTP